MKKKLSVAAGILLTALSAAAAMPQYDLIPSPAPVSSYGDITRLSVRSENLGGDVIIDVWTPKGYEASASEGYPVVYAHDGQNLFDASYCFAGVPWGIDKGCSLLSRTGDFTMPIIVGINNRGASGLRPNDYFPENALEYISTDDKDKTYIYKTCPKGFLGNEEAAFVVEELKPLVDHLYNTAPQRETTFAIGSSMGGLASMYLLCEYPEIFGGAACMSTHWIGSLDLNPDYTMNDDEVCANAILEYLEENLPSAGSHRLYMDQGTKDWDAGYLKYEARAREIARGKGYTEENGHLFVYDAKGAGHNEWYWQQRITVPLKFLLSKGAIGSAGIPVMGSEMENTPGDRHVCDLTGKRYSISDFERLPAGIYILDGKKKMKK
ncbi:MAG: esterase family protein [Muribaculaceae bacterium]|nr:esterase family protein [Muribaculaceae bacterium]